MIASLVLAIGDLADRRILAILGRSLLWTLAIFAGLGLLLFWMLRAADPCAAVGLDGCPFDAGSSGIGAALLMLLAIWFLFPAVALGVIANYADAIVAAVEERHYPVAAAGARRLGVAGSAWFGLRQSLRVLMYNLVALPLYIVLMVTGIGPLILFVIVNGLAAGADLGAMVAARHDARDRRPWLRHSRGERLAIGLVVAALLLIPIANLFAPILGAAAMAHLYQRGRTPERRLAR